MMIRVDDRGRDSSLISRVRATLVWRPDFLSGRIVAMVGFLLRE
jgi:hypothetical protein